MKISLDLLPKQRKLELKRKKIFRRILSQEFLFLLPVLLLIIIILNIYYLVTLARDTSIAEHAVIQSQDKYQELSAYENKFNQVNETSASLLKIQAGHLHWGKVLEKMSSIVPDTITITNFSTKNYQIFLLGKAKNRDILLKFKSELESDQCFENVNVPLSNLVVKDNIDFQMDFSIKQDCLKQQ